MSPQRRNPGQEIAQRIVAAVPGAGLDKIHSSGGVTMVTLPGPDSRWALVSAAGQVTMALSHVPGDAAVRMLAALSEGPPPPSGQPPPPEGATGPPA